MTETKTCTICGEQYGRKKGIGSRQWANSKYCGYDCYWASKRSNSPPKPCEECGKMMDRPAGQFSDKTWAEKKYCSDACARPAKAERMKRLAAESALHEDVRLWDGVKVGGPDECWEWQRACNSKGYGVIGASGPLSSRPRVLATHRLAYELTHGPIPAYLLVRHSCHNPKCCNPAHLSLGTHKDNHDDAVAAGRHTHGEKQGQAKLTDETALEIFHAAGKYEDIARQYGVSVSTVGHIKTKRVWKHIHDTG